MPKCHVLSMISTSLALVTLTACAPAETRTPEPEEKSEQAIETPAGEGRALVLGDISDDPAEVIEGTQPLADYLAAGLAEFGISEGRVVVAQSADEMARLLEEGEVDVYFDSVYPATLIADQTGAEIFVRRWRFGVEEYYTVIFASAESGVTSLEDLRGHMIVFDNAFSTSGFLLPAVTLVESDLALVGKQSYNEPVAEDEVGFVFSYDDENTLQWVLSGFATAGATDDYNFEQVFPADVKESLVVLARTEPVPRQVGVASPDLAPDLLVALNDILVTAHETEEGQAALEPFQTTRFDDFPEGIEAAQERMRAMMEIVQDIPTP